MKRPAAAALLVVTFAATAASADHSFLLPSASNVTAPPSIVTIDAAGSDNVFQFDHRPIQLQQIKVYRPDGGEAPAPEGTTSRFRSSFDLKLDAAGTWKVTSLSVIVGGTAMVGGEERRVTSFRFPGRPGGGGPSGPGGAPDRARPGGGPSPGGGPDGQRRQPPILLAELPADATDVKLTETVGRTEAFVTAGEPTTAVFGGDTRGLTLRPITHPTDLVVKEPAKFRFLLDGKPAAGIKVAVVAGGQRFRDSEAATEYTTDAQGIVTVRWPAPGYYWLGATAEDGNPQEKRAATRRLSYAVTLEVAAS